MTNLNFSEPIKLPYGQTLSVVVDGSIEKEGQEEVKEEDKEYKPVIINYGLIPSEIITEQGKEIETFKLCYNVIDLDENRNFKVLESQSSAEEVLKEVGAEGLENIISYTAKTMPHYGSYGFVNYDLGETSSYQYGLSLSESRSGGNIF